MKSLRDLIKESNVQKKVKCPSEILNTQVKNYECFSDAELKEYFSSEKFEKQLKACEEPYFLLEDEGCFQFFIFKRNDDGIGIALDGLFVPD